jgi:hypothetical protein
MAGDEPFWDPSVPGRCGRGRGRGCYSLLSSFDGLMPHVLTASSADAACPAQQNSAPPECASTLDSTEAAPTVAQAESNDTRFDGPTLRLRLLAFYRLREPAKLAHVGRVVQTYLDKQAELNRLLQRRYGADLFAVASE